MADEEGREIEKEEVPDIPDIKYEYLDHTADVQLHAWGDDLKEAFEQVAVAMFGYMTTDFTLVDMTRVHTVTATGDDMMSLLYHFLDEFLFLFCVEPFTICRVVKIVEFDRENFTIKAEGYGETFDISKHPQGTEVKAITYSNMQIHDKLDPVDDTSECGQQRSESSPQACEFSQQACESDPQARELSQQACESNPQASGDSFPEESKLSHVFVIIDI